MILRIITLFHKLWQDFRFFIFIKFYKKRDVQIDISKFEELREILKGFKGFEGLREKIEIKGDVPDLFYKKVFYNFLKPKYFKNVDVREIKEIERDDFFYFKFLKGVLKEDEIKDFIFKKMGKFKFPEGFLWRDGLELSILILRVGLFFSNIDMDEGMKDFFYLLGKSVERHLSLFGSKNNHFIGELSSLFLFYYVLKDERKLNKFSKKIEMEFKNQFSYEGISFEGINYQIQDLEWLFLYIFIQRARGKKLGEEFKNLILKSHNFLENYFLIRHDISFGDNDDGNILSPPFTIYGRYQFLKHLYSRINFEAKEEFLPLKSGYFIGSFGDFFIILKCGDLELKPRNVHSHADNGSFILFYREKPILVDSGTFCYRCSRELRNYFRSVGAHNVFILEGNYFLLKYPFGIKKFLKGEINEVKYFKDFCEVSFSLFLNKGIKVTRSIKISEKSVSIKNMVKGVKGRKKCYRFYNFLKDIKINGNSSWIDVNLGNLRFKFHIRSGNPKLIKGNSYFSDRFFEKFNKSAIYIEDEIGEGEVIEDILEVM